MFERFTERARRAMIIAQNEVRRLNHSVVEPEHILLGILHGNEGAAIEVLNRLDIPPERVRAEVEGAIGLGKHAPYEEVAYSGRSKRVFEMALDEARRLRHNYIGTEHLLLGLLREGQGAAAEVLEAMGADLDRVRAEVVRFLADEETALMTPKSSGAPDSGTAIGASLEAEVARLTEESQRNFQQFLRTAADLENYKKQAGRQRDEAVAATRRAMVGVILTVADTLERALEHANASGDGSAAAILEGIRLAHRQVLDTLKSVGVRPMESVGQQFDPRVHDAVAAVPAPDGTERGVIVDEVQRGYLMGEDVLRPARVRVAQ